MDPWDISLRFWRLQIAVGKPGMIFLESKYLSIGSIYFFILPFPVKVEFFVRGK